MGIRSFILSQLRREHHASGNLYKCGYLQVKEATYQLGANS